MTLQEAYEAYLEQWTHWQKTTEKYPEEGFWHSLNELVEAAAMPANLQPYHHAPAANFIRAWIEFVPSLEEGTARVPGHNVNDSLTRLMDAKLEIKAPTEGPEELAASGVRDDQIAKLMGWSPVEIRQFRVAFHAKRSGEEYNKDHLKRPAQTPEELERIEMAAKIKADYLLAVRQLEGFANSREKPSVLIEAVDDWKEPPETVEELHAAGVSIEQISRMWRKSQSEVQAIINGGNVALDDPTQDQIAAEIKALAESDPNVDHETIAEMLGVDAGIVAEVLG